MSINLTAFGSSADLKTLMLYDESGRRIDEKLSTNSVVTWALDKLQAGAYLIEVRCKGQVGVGRLVGQ
ncbi:MAG: T9SS type A sorting domain-containing protein [Flavobacteriales bacterium]|nr:T9SS type A sorting domain-containing protein [Flavobacteriales bacterium]